MSYYARNRLRAQTVNNEPTLTDQSQARETDINIIVGRFIRQGTAPGQPGQPLQGIDWTVYPTDLREFIETSRQLRDHYASLPEPLRKYSVDELVGLTADQLTNILKPPAPPPATEENKS